MLCKECQREIDDCSKFCSFCGKIQSDFLGPEERTIYERYCPAHVELGLFRRS